MLPTNKNKIMQSETTNWRDNHIDKIIKKANLCLLKVATESLQLSNRKVFSEVINTKMWNNYNLNPAEPSWPYKWIWKYCNLFPKVCSLSPKSDPQCFLVTNGLQSYSLQNKCHFIYLCVDKQEAKKKIS